MKIIGLTGGIGSGKSTVSAKFSELGAKVIDADKISRGILDFGSDAYNEVVNHFGNGILDAENNINRKALAKIVFSDKAELKILNSITHKYIFLEMEKDIEKYRQSDYDNKIIILDVPLLFSAYFPIKCDKTIAVIADEDTRIKRVMARDGYTESDVKNRIKNQLTSDELKNLADYILENNNGIDKINKEIESLYYELGFV